MTARRLVRLLAVVLLAVPLAGCWSRIETNELGVVIGFGVDWHAGRYEVTASVLNPRGLGTPGAGGQSNPNQPSHVLLTGSGATPGQALADVNTGSSRKLMWGSAEVMVIGQSLAQHGINPLLSALTHEPYFRPTTRMLIAHGDARDIFRVDQSGLETSIGRHLFLMVQNVHRSDSYAWAPHVFDVARWESEQGRAMLLPGLTGYQPPLPQGVGYAVEDSAVLENGRLVAWLPRAQVRPVLWMEGLFVHGPFDVSCPGKPGTMGVVNITKGDEKIRTVVRGNRIVAFDVGLTGKAVVSQSCPGASASAMGQAATDAVKSAAQQSLDWAQARRQDVVGFGEIAFRYHPHVFLDRYQRNWPASFAGIPVRLSVNVKITLTGITR